MNRKFGLCVMTGAMFAALAGSAEAVQLTGSFSKTGTFEPVTCTAGICAPATSLDTANAIDITTIAGTPSPGVIGPVLGSNATLDFFTLGLNGATGTMADFSFAGTGGLGFPVAPIASFEIFPGILTFNLTSVSVSFQSASQLGLLGIGTFTGMAGFDPTPGTFNFTGQGSAGSFTFSATQTATPATVPDGGSTAALLGSALVAFGMLRRKISNI